MTNFCVKLPHHFIKIHPIKPFCQMRSTPRIDKFCCPVSVSVGSIVVGIFTFAMCISSGVFFILTIWQYLELGRTIDQDIQLANANIIKYSQSFDQWSNLKLKLVFQLPTREYFLVSNRSVKSTHLIPLAGQIDEHSWKGSLFTLSIIEIYAKFHRSTRIHSLCVVSLQEEHMGTTISAVLLFQFQ
jgi:hypothetical protein